MIDDVIILIFAIKVLTYFFQSLNTLTPVSQKFTNPVKSETMVKLSCVPTAHLFSLGKTEFPHKLINKHIIRKSCKQMK